ncbi:hypothetical protein NE237_011829 [Protea cynaroides]|uniref:RNase H type-1 domain-containing protein n=1 Tax=Protea cynaroides TaxID=273540 RepID=A0A9Q0GXY1_9MAGN|nr:hypothetical protein NE237_011829 [Protea cynaroides]
MAIRQAIFLALQFQLHPFIVKSDSLEVISCLNSSVSSSDRFLDDIVKDIKALLPSDDFVTVMYIPRSANVVAHEVAQRAREGMGIKLWDGSVVWLMDFCTDPVFSEYQ